MTNQPNKATVKEYKRHRYDGIATSRALDYSVAQCCRCGVIREFVKGEVHYFIPSSESVVFKSPKCIPGKYFYDEQQEQR